MLEKFFDAHLHINSRFSLTKATEGKKSECYGPENFYGCISLAEDEADFLRKDLLSDFPGNEKNYVFSYGVHPLNVRKDNLFVLEELLEKNKLSAVGECGLDFYERDFDKKLQLEIFYDQIELAKKYNKPLVIHGRKCNSDIFAMAGELKKLPAVLFHSFMGSEIEGESLLRKGINCYFSFGKQMVNNNKKVIACAQKLPLENLLCETDAPYQFLKGESCTFIEEIQKVYKNLALLRGMESEENFRNLLSLMETNFRKFFGTL